MADFLITDIVTPDAIKSVTDLTAALESSRDAFADYASEIAKASTGASQSFNDLKQRVEAFEKQQRAMQQTQAQYNQQTAALRAELQKVEQELRNAQQAQAATQQATQQATQSTKEQIAAAAERRQAAVETAQALEAERAAMLEKFQIDAEAKKLMDDTLGTYEANIQRLADVETQLRSVADQTKALNDQQRAGIISDEDATKARAKLLERERELKVSKSDLQRILKNEEKAAQEAEGSYKQLSLQLTRMKDAYKQLNEQERNSTAGRQLLADIQALDLGLKGSAGTMGEYQRNVGDYENAILRALGVNNRFAQSILGMTREGGGLAGFFTNAGNAAKAFGKTLLTLLSNPVFLTIAGIGGAIAAGKWFFDYNQGLAEASRLTSELTGKMGEDMQGFRNEVQAVADTFGSDYKDTLQTAETLVVQFGISWEEAIDIIRSGFAAGADLNGTFLSNIKQYAPSFRDANLSAREFVATISNTRQGIFSDQGLTIVQTAFKRIREMSDSTRKALQGIGIDVDDLTRRLADGSLSMSDAVKMISEKFAEVGVNSQEAGAIMKDVFGRGGAAGGAELIKALKDIETDLDKVKEQTGEWGEMQEKLAKSQEDLNDAMSTLFDVTGKGWEGFITQVKIIVNEWLVKFINKIIELVNGFIDWYNSSQTVRLALAGVWAAVKNVWSITKTFINLVIDGFKSVVRQLKAVAEGFDGVWDILHGDVNLGFGKIGKAIKDAGQALVDTVAEVFTDVGNGVQEGIANVSQIGANANITLGHLERPTHAGGGSSGGGGGTGNDGNNNNNNNNGGGKGRGRSGGGNSRSNSDAQAQARYEADILKRLYEARLAVMEESYEKEVLIIKAKWAEKLAVIKGESENETELRVLYTKQMYDEIDAVTAKYDERRLSIEEKDLQNLLETFTEEQKLTEEYHAARVRLIEVQRREAVTAAEKEGLDVGAVEDKYYKMLVDADREFYESRTAARMAALTKWQTTLSQQRAREFQDEKNDLAKRLRDGLITYEEYEKQLQEMQAAYSLEEARTQTAALKQQLNVVGITAEQRLELEQKLAQAEIALEEAKNAAIVRGIQQQEQERQKSLDNAIKGVQMAQQFLTEFNNLGKALFERQAQELEDAQARLDKAYEAETARVEKLQENGAISTEEAERRKEVAERKHAQEQERIAKKQAELKRKEALLEKANNISTTIMNTAVAIMQAWKQGGSLSSRIAQTALISALGAVQLATIVAQPIPKYARGTDFHAGGLAVVGDGGRSEMVLTGGKMWVTPKVPTMVELPRGAQVLPDAAAVMSQIGNITPVVNVQNDFTRLERATLQNAKEIRNLQRIVTRNYNDAEYMRQYERI